MIGAMHTHLGRTTVALLSAVALTALTGAVCRGGDFTVDGLTVYGEQVITQQVGQGSVPLGNLRLVYSCDEDGGSTVSDDSGNGFDGSVSGATWTPDGKLNAAYDFDGNDTVSRSDGAFLALDANAFSIAAWVRIESLSNWGGIVQQGNIISQPVSGFGLYARQDAKFALRVRQGGGGCVDVSWGSVSPGQWYHVAGVRTYSGGNTVNELYVDGALVATNSSASTCDVDTSDVFYVGKGYTYLNGMIDETAIYSRALSSNEVHDLYLYSGTNFCAAALTVHSPATFTSNAVFTAGIEYVAPLSDVEMGIYTNQP